MIVFDSRKLGGFDVFLHYCGSAAYNRHSIPQAILSGGLCTFFAYFPELQWLRDHVLQANAYTGTVSFIVSFVVVYRAQIAYQRYSESQAAYFRMVSKLHDFLSFMNAFLTGNDERSCEMRNTIIRWCRAYHNLAIEEFQGVGFVSSKTNKDPAFKRPDLTEDEVELLQRDRKRNIQVSSWILRLIVENRQLIRCGDAILSRAFQISSEANLYFNECRRIVETPFPFPFVQLTQIMIYLWIFIMPVVVGTFFPESYLLAFVIAGSSTWILCAVNEVAAILENPWEEASNNLPALYYTVAFEDDVGSMKYVKYPDVFNSLREMSGNNSIEFKDVGAPEYTHSMPMPKEMAQGLHHSKSMDSAFVGANFEHSHLDTNMSNTGENNPYRQQIQKSHQSGIDRNSAKFAGEQRKSSVDSGAAHLGLPLEGEALFRSFRRKTILPDILDEPLMKKRRSCTADDVSLRDEPSSTPLMSLFRDDNNLPSLRQAKPTIERSKSLEEAPRRQLTENQESETKASVVPSGSQPDMLEAHFDANDLVSNADDRANSDGAMTENDEDYLSDDDIPESNVLYHTVHGTCAKQMTTDLKNERDKHRLLAAHRAYLLQKRIHDQRIHMRHHFGQVDPVRPNDLDSKSSARSGGSRPKKALRFFSDATESFLRKKPSQKEWPETDEHNSGSQNIEQPYESDIHEEDKFEESKEIISETESILTALPPRFLSSHDQQGIVSAPSWKDGDYLINLWPTTAENHSMTLTQVRSRGKFQLIT